MKKFIVVAVVVNVVMMWACLLKGNYTMASMHMIWCSSGSAYLLK